MSQDSKLKKAKIEALIIIFTPQRQRKIGPKKILLIFLKKHEPQNDLFIFFLKSVCYTFITFCIRINDDGICIKFIFTKN